MAPADARDDASWAEIEQHYIAGTLTVPAILTRYRIGKAALYRRLDERSVPRRSASGIPRRAPAASVAPATVRKRTAAGTHESAASPKPANPTTTASRKALVARLYRAIDIKLQRLERRMTSGEEPTIADSERETRELAHMIRSFEKVTEVAADIAQCAAKPAAGTGKRKSGAGSKLGSDAAAGRPVYVSADAERMRHEIAERLEKLHRGRHAGK